MAKEDYEILPHQVLIDLKDEVEALKKKLLEPDTKGNELLLEMESLKDSIQELSTIFQKALEQAKGQDLYPKFSALLEKVDAVVGQNETIARGMIAISDKVDDWMKRQGGLGGMPGSGAGMGVQHSMGLPPMMGAPPRMAPPPMMEAMPDLDMPPPPPGMKRKGLF